MSATEKSASLRAMVVTARAMAQEIETRLHDAQHTETDNGLIGSMAGLDTQVARLAMLIDGANELHKIRVTP